MSEEQLHEQIEAYLLGNMTVEEEAAFQAQIDADPALQAAVDAQRQAIKAIRLQSEADMRRKMNQWRQGANTPAPPPPFQFTALAEVGVDHAGLRFAGLVSADASRNHFSESAAARRVVG